MKKFLSFVLMATMSVGAFADAFYCDPAQTDPSAGGLDWDDALSPGVLRSEISVLEDGDTVFFKGGTIKVSQLSELWTVNRSLTFIGGFDPTATGSVTTMPTYPSPTPTVFNGDANQNGKPDKGDAQALLRIDFSGDVSRVFHLQGFDFINTYYDGEVDSPDDVKTSTAMSAALRILCGTAFVSNCHFYNHITPEGRGSQCVTSVGAKLHMRDCELHDGISMTRGGLLRSRQYFPSGKDTVGAINPDCVLERCALYNGNNMGGADINSAGFYGGAIQVSYGPFFAINTTIANSKGYSDGGGLNANVSGATLISCTLANSKCTRAVDPTSTSQGAYGSNFHINKDGVLRIANSIVLGPDDDGTKLYCPLYSDQNVNGIATNCISGGYNITGTYFYYANGSEQNDQSKTWLATDKYTTPKGQTIQSMADYLGADPQMTDNGGFSKTMKPLAMQNGDNVAHLQQLADQWCPKWTKVDASVDQRGYQRDANITCVGAMAVENNPTSLPVQKAECSMQNGKVMINGQLMIIRNGVRYNINGQMVE